MSTAKFNQWLNTDGTENYKCRAWVLVTVGAGSVPSISASGNVSSITDIAAGALGVSFATPMPDALYAPVISSQFGSTAGTLAYFDQTEAKTANGFNAAHFENGNTVDPYFYAIHVVR